MLLGKSLALNMFRAILLQPIIRRFNIQKITKTQMKNTKFNHKDSNFPNENPKKKPRKQATNLKFHPIKEVPSLSPTFLLLQNHTHLSKTQLPHKRSHHLSHIIPTFTSHSQSPHLLYRRHHVPTVQVAIPIILKILHHLLRRPLNPLGCLRSRALVLAQLAKVLSLGLDYAPRVVVGEWVFGVFGPGFWLGWVVAIAERPWVWCHWRRRRVDCGFGFCWWRWFVRREEWDWEWDVGEEGGLEVEV